MGHEGGPTRPDQGSRRGRYRSPSDGLMAVGLQSKSTTWVIHRGVDKFGVIHRLWISFVVLQYCNQGLNGRSGPG